MVSAGRILILPKGDWNNTTMYNMLDLVSYNGITWLCKRQCVGITPSVEQVEYWQQFGSAAPIASTSVAGLVMPDGSTITIDPTTGAIAVPIAKTNGVGLVKPDGTTITIDANGVISSTGGNLSNLGDVAITSLQNGQTIVWNAANQKWQNGDVAGTLAALSDVTITSATDGQIFAYSASQGKWVNVTAESTLSNSTKPIQTKVVKDMASDVIETLSAGASQAYSAGDLIMCSNGKWYKAITDISQNQTLTAGGNVEETSQRALNTNLTQSLETLSDNVLNLADMEAISISRSLSNNTWTEIFKYTATANETLIILGVFACWGNANAIAQLSLAKNGTGVATFSIFATASDVFTQGVPWVIHLNSGDVFTISALKNTGGSISLNGSCNKPNQHV